MAEKQSKWRIFTAGIIRENPVLRLVLGCCSALAVTTTVSGALAGMTLRSAEITMLEQTRTNVMARPMPTAPETVVVTASAEQQPSTRRRTGFSRMMPAVKTFHLLGFSFIVTAPP